MQQAIKSFSVTVSIGFIFFFMLLSIDQGFEKNVLPTCTTVQALMSISALQTEDDTDMFCTQRRTAPPTKTLETEREALLFAGVTPLFPLDSTRKLTTQFAPGVTVPPPIL